MRYVKGWCCSKGMTECIGCVLNIAMTCSANLYGWWGDLHAQDDVPHFALGQGADIDVVFLSVVGKDEIF